MMNKMKITRAQLEKATSAVLDYREIKRGSKYLPHVRKKQETYIRQTILIALEMLPPKSRNI